MTSPIENVLSRLEKVRQRQPGQWAARCPAHNDKSPSLSIRESTDGGVLLHCFAACDVTAVVAALGMQMHELFPPRDKPAGAPKKIANLLTAGQALELLANESMLVAVAAGNVGHGVKLTATDKDRLLLAAGRINVVRDQTKGALHA